MAHPCWRLCFAEKGHTSVDPGVSSFHENYLTASNSAQRRGPIPRISVYGQGRSHLQFARRFPPPGRLWPKGQPGIGTSGTTDQHEI
jgi:hypothetical protein